MIVSAHLDSETQRCHIKISAVDYVILDITVDKVEKQDHIHLPQSLRQHLPGALTLVFCYRNPRCAGNVGTACRRWSEMSAPAWGLLTLTSLPSSSHCLISAGEPRHLAAGLCLMQSTWERRLVWVHQGNRVTNSLHVSGMQEGCLEGGLEDLRLDEVT